MRKRTRAGSIAAAAALVLLATGCNPFSGALPGDPEPSPYFIQHLQGEGTYPLNLDLGDETRDVYLTFVNPNLYDAWGSLTVSGSAAGQESSAEEASASIVSSLPVERRAPTPAFITEFNQNPFGGRTRSAPSLRLLERPSAPLLDAVGSKVGNVFYNYDLTDVDATCRKVVKDVIVAGGGTRTLNIWVADNCWYVGGTKAKLVTQTMVDALADQFLLAGGNTFDDIYDWVTGMLGPEWGSTGYSELIPANNEITILLCDIANDNSAEGGIVGYFWSKDNYTTEYQSYSSERVMFAIDAVMYANGDGTWDSTDSWPEEIYSTLAHEFQHMIHFYQREVLRDAVASGDTWINEMASLVVEDLLADKMGVIGPRGVDSTVYTDGSAGAPLNTEGRLPLFINYPGESLSEWGYDLESYSVAYAFGAWLARNYGGAELLNRLMNCSSTGPASIEDIVALETGHGESFDRILQRWSAAALLSDATDAPFGYEYNSGGFFDSTVNGNAYRLGSINLFNYTYSTQVGPRVYSGGTVGTSEHPSTSMALYQAALLGTGVFEWTLDMPPGLIATVVAK
jgi:hypothetical protein